MKFNDQNKAPITEIFSSFQGEGARAGERQIFIRFSGCNIKCRYCDEANNKVRQYSVSEVISEVKRLNKIARHSVISLTGGEPLIYIDFLMSLVRVLKKLNFKILLETNGILWKNYRLVSAAVDIVSMDIKLPSVTGSGNFLREHGQFLSLAKKKEIYLKAVVRKGLNLKEFKEHLEVIKKNAAEIVLYLQLAFNRKEKYVSKSNIKFLDCTQKMASKILSNARIGVQLHKILSIK